MIEGNELFRDITTHWSRLKGPPREALDYLFRVYGRAVSNYIGGRLHRGDFRPLRMDDRDDLLQEFFLRIGTTEWLRKPDPARGKFRPYFVKRLTLFLREKRAAARANRPEAQSGADEAPEPASPDPLEILLEDEWRLAACRETLERIRRSNVRSHDVLKLHMEQEGRLAATLAASLGMTTDAFRGHLKRAKRQFREVFEIVSRRLDGFGGEQF